MESNYGNNSILERSPQCGICEIFCQSATHLQIHMKTHHPGGKVFKCDYCDRKFKEPASLKAHARIHVGPKPFICNICERPFSDKQTLITHKARHMNHMREAGRKIGPQREVNVCVVCEKQFRDRNLFVQHEMQHTKQSSITCRFCFVTFKHFNVVKNHILKQHMQQLTAKPPPPPTLPPAPKSPLHRGSPILAASPSNGTKMECKMCKLVFGDSNTFQRHMNAHGRPNGPSSSAAPSPGKPSTPPVDNILQKLTAFGNEITIEPVSHNNSSPATPGLGLVISSVQSVSMSYLEELERRSEELRRKRLEKRRSESMNIKKETQNEEQETFKVFDVSPEVVVEVKRRSSASSVEDVKKFIKSENGVLPEIELVPKENGDIKKEEGDEEQELAVNNNINKKKFIKRKRQIIERPTPSQTPPEGPTRRSSSRTSNNASLIAQYREEDQPASIKKFHHRSKNGVVHKRRIYPCGKCKAMFDNQESRKMHFITVHLSKIQSNEGDAGVEQKHQQQRRMQPQKKRRLQNNVKPIEDPFAEVTEEPIEDPLAEVQTEPFSYIHDQDDEEEEDEYEESVPPKLKLKISGGKVHMREQ